MRVNEKEYIAGDTVFDLVSRENLPEICLRQIKEMCFLLYKAGLNIDYFPDHRSEGGETQDLD